MFDKKVTFGDLAKAVYKTCRRRRVNPEDVTNRMLALGVVRFDKPEQAKQLTRQFAETLD